MFSEKIFTLDEIAQHLRVPQEVVLQDVASGRLRVRRIGEHIRVCESDFNAYLDASVELADDQAAATAITAGEAKDVIKLSPTKPFKHTWPAPKGNVKITETFTDAHEGIVSHGGRERHIRIGFTLRKSAGKVRRRCLIIVDRYPTVEFVAADDTPNGKMASIIRGRAGKQLPVGASLPPEYKDLPVAAYNDVVQGPRASNGVAVICDSHDFATMVKHALIRHRFQGERAKNRMAAKLLRN